MGTHLVSLVVEIGLRFVLMESRRLVQMHLTLVRVEVLQVDEGVALRLMVVLVVRQVVVLVRVRRARVPAQGAVHAVHGGVHDGRAVRKISVR